MSSYKIPGTNLTIPEQTINNLSDQELIQLAQHSTDLIIKELIKRIEVYDCFRHRNDRINRK